MFSCVDCCVCIQGPAGLCAAGLALFEVGLVSGTTTTGAPNEQTDTAARCVLPCTFLNRARLWRPLRVPARDSATR